MSSVRITSSISGTLDGVTHSITGAATINVAGCIAESVAVSGTYAVVQAPIGKTFRALIHNDGATEIKVRILRVAATTWQYFNIPAGRIFTIYTTEDAVYEADIEEIAVKTVLGGVGRAIVLQAWR